MSEPSCMLPAEHQGVLPSADQLQVCHCQSILPMTVRTTPCSTGGHTGEHTCSPVLCASFQKHILAGVPKCFCSPMLSMMQAWMITPCQQPMLSAVAMPHQLVSGSHLTHPYVQCRIASRNGASDTSRCDSKILPLLGARRRIFLVLHNLISSSAHAHSQELPAARRQTLRGRPNSQCARVTRVATSAQTIATLAWKPILLCLSSGVPPKL